MSKHTLTSKPHYAILDGLRGVAALMVVAFHLFEAHASSHLNQVINHGYLAVDFFFLLSGFVIGYAYDDRWGSMSFGTFLKRRIIRLQPMLIMGMIVGAALFYFQDYAIFPMIGEVPLWKVLLIMLIGFTMIPVTPNMDIRGWEEMHPLNGPAWSLFFEYLANIFYGLFIRKFSNKWLCVFVCLAAVFLIHLSLTNPTGDVVGGWSFNEKQLHIGFARLLYPFFAGLLLSRIVKIGIFKHSFLISSLLLVMVLAIPRIGGAAHFWMNGIYESVAIIFVFPLIVYIGASGEILGKNLKKITAFLGDISYPIYITHYPIIYIYTGWAIEKKLTMKEAYPMAILAFLCSIFLAYILNKWIDVPVRKWLGKKFLQ